FHVHAAVSQMTSSAVRSLTFVSVNVTGLRSDDDSSTVKPAAFASTCRMSAGLALTYCTETRISNGADAERELTCAEITAVCLSCCSVAERDVACANDQDTASSTVDAVNPMVRTIFFMTVLIAETR